MKGPRLFRPNDATDPAFGEALREARRAGVKVVAVEPATSAVLSTHTAGFSGYTYSTQTLINAADDVLAGDVDLNGTVNIQDATLLQRYFAEYTTLTSAQLRAADANKDGKVNIRDVTQIQRINAGFVS